MTKLSYYIAWAGFLICAFLVWYFSNKGRQEERKILIDKGVDVESIFRKSDKRRQLWLLKLGIVVIGLGLAFVLIAVLDRLNLMHPDALFPGIFCVCIGLSLIIAHQVGKKGNED